MKISAQEEYALRILLRIAKEDNSEGLSIPQLSKEEHITQPYVAKITRLLRMNGFINSTKGHKGGYILSKPAKQIKINKVLKAIGGALYDQDFCSGFSCEHKANCTSGNDCSVRSLWKILQYSLDSILEKINLQDLICTEKDALQKLNAILKNNAVELSKSK